MFQAENPMTSKQIDHWKSSFGNEYTERNEINPVTRLPAFKEMLSECLVGSVLEVGCNKGHNLITLSHMFPTSNLVGLDPNKQALRVARSSTTDACFMEGVCSDIPFKDSFFDLVMTCGVLIHVPLQDLKQCISEIYRVANNYILSVEYFAEKETVIPYRGHDELLWKRNFLKHYQSLFPDLNLLRQGYWDKSDGFDRCNWWLFSKHEQSSQC
jgi:pseudaminic acid biosynthesis-associated methylase